MGVASRTPMRSMRNPPLRSVKSIACGNEYSALYIARLSLRQTEQIMEDNRKDATTWLERPIFPSVPVITFEALIFAAIILLALASRFYNLGARVMSHDESLHTY